MRVLKLYFLLIYAVLSSNALNITFTPNIVTITMGDEAIINYEFYDIDDMAGESMIIYSQNDKIGYLENKLLVLNPSETSNGSFKILGNFLGRTSIVTRSYSTNELFNSNIEVAVVRRVTVVDTIFTVSVATLVSLIYINFGCALDWNEPKKILKKPIGPAIGFCGQFVVMPVLSYGLGQLLFPENPEMQLGMFFTGVSPGGGASNLWTVLLEGNLSLSIIMSAVSTLAAFGMMPLWIFSLGRIIFNNANLEVPYTQIVTYVLGLLVPLGIGYLIQRYLSKVSNFLKRIMTGFSAVLIIFIIIFASVANLYLFELFSWKIIVAGMALPWLGYILGYIVAKLLKQSGQDCTAIAVEVGIQNTGISIFLLRFSLPQPEADLTTVIPVSVAILTPLPLVCWYLFKKIRKRFPSTGSDKVENSEATKEVSDTENKVSIESGKLGIKA